MRTFAVAWAVFTKDVRAELRSREALVSMGAFALLCVVVFGLAFEHFLSSPVGGATGGKSFALVVAPGLLWLAVAFSGILGLNRSFAMEREGGALYGLMLSPADRGAVYLGKTAANTLFLIVIEALILPVFSLLFNVAVVGALGRLLLIGPLGALGFSAAGTIFAAVAANTRMRDIMLPLLLIPVIVPVLVAAIEATGAALSGAEGSSGALTYLALFPVIYLSASYLLFGTILEE